MRKEGLHGPSLLEFTWKLRNTKLAIKNWTKRKIRTGEELKKVHNTLEQKKKELFQDLQNITKQEEIKEISIKIRELEQIKEENLRQCSRAYWLRLGD